VTDSENLPARRQSEEPALLSEEADHLSLCPSCGRQTRTVGRGTCSECWQPKTPDGEPALRSLAPRTLPLLGSIDDVPIWVWIGLAAALTGGVLGAVLFAL
jgi:hypothetical protein